VTGVPSALAGDGAAAVERRQRDGVRDVRERQRQGEIVGHRRRTIDVRRRPGYA
jgi:hypothetical protein